MKSSLLRRLPACGIGLALLCGGCASWDLPKLKPLKLPAAPDLHPIREERADAAIKHFDKERNRAQYEAAAGAWRQGDFAACRAGLDTILQRAPEHRESLLLLAAIELEQDRPAAAVEALRTAVAAHPQDADVNYNLALALEADHQSSEALHFFQVAVQSAPTETKYAEAFEFCRANVERGDGTAVASDSAEPVEMPEPPQVAVEGPAPIVVTETVQTAAEQDLPSTKAVSAAAPRDDEFAALLELRETSDERPFERALTKFLAKEPRHIEAGILQAEIDLQRDRGAAARDRMERMVIRHPADAQVRRACGLVYEALGAADRAEACFTRAAELEQAGPQPQGEYQAAAIPASYASDFAVSDLAVKLPPQESVEQIVAPDVPSAATIEAIESTVGDEVVEITAEPMSADQQSARAAALLRSGDTAGAREAFFAAAACDSENPKRYADAALKALQAEQSELARELASEGARQFPESAGLHRLHGTAALRLGRHAEAEAALRQSLSLDNSQALTYFLLGSALDRLGKSDSAQWHLRQAARLDGRYAVRR